MRPLEPFRLSNIVSVNLTTLMHKQVKHYAATHNLTIASTVRDAINAFTHAPQTYRTPNITALLRADPSLPSRIIRNRTIVLTLLPSDRAPLDQLSRDTLLPCSSLMRRAIYEHTKADNDTEMRVPELLMDAWGDQPLAALPQSRPADKRRKKKTPT
jgi:hypothetical protein